MHLGEAMKYNMQLHKRRLAHALLVGWIPQAIQVHKFLIQNEAQVRERTKPDQNPNDVMVATRIEVMRSAADFHTAKLVKYNDVSDFLRRLATFLTQRDGRSRVLYEGLEASFSVL